MKNRIKIIGMTFIAVICFESCEKTYMEPNINNFSEHSGSMQWTPVSGNTNDTIMISPGTWRISFFHLNSVQDAGYFQNYIFKFKVGGALTAVYEYKDFNGIWDEGRGFIKINFGDMPVLSKLNKDRWVIGKHSFNHIELGINNTSDIKNRSDNEFLVLEKVMTY